MEKALDDPLFKSARRALCANTRATLFPWADWVFPIMPVYRKLEVAIMPVYRKLKSPTCNGLQSKRAGTAISVFLGPH